MLIVFLTSQKWHLSAGLRIPGDQRQIGSALPLHLVDVLPVGDGAQTFADTSGKVYKLWKSMSI